jgi:hypothetical protein
MWRAFGALVVVLAAVSCGDDTTAELLGDTPPWGLTSIDMPDTEEDVVAVIAALPDEIDGRRRPDVGDADLGGVSYGESGIFWTVNASSWEDLQSVLVNPQYPSHTPAELVVTLPSWFGSLGTVEASALDLDGDLVWIAASEVWEGPDLPPDQQGTVYTMIWAQPDGSWAFHIQADSAAGRVQLVHAFITAAAG